MLEFYGLREHPFGVSPDPRFLYPSSQHREAMASLAFGIENQVGIAALIAEPGAGKTTLLFDVLQRFQHRASTAFVFNTQCGGADLLRQIVVELAIPDGENERDPIRLHQLFTSFVAGQLRTKPVVIIIDEAQNLENSALETLRLLSNFEAADRKLLHIILAGQPQLADKLRHRSLTQLLQRITMVSRLGRFSRKQMEECIAFRLQVAGFDGRALFSTTALDRIMEASGGVPRELNRICINAMQLGYATRQRLIGEDVVDEVISDLTLAKWIPEAELPMMGMREPAVEDRVAAPQAGVSNSPAPAPDTLPAEQEKPGAAIQAETDSPDLRESSIKQTPRNMGAPEPLPDYKPAYRPGPPRQPVARRPLHSGGTARSREAWQPEEVQAVPPPAAPQLAARIEAVNRDVEAENGISYPAPAQNQYGEAPAQRGLDRDTRRALLEAAAQRRRQAELRLAGIRHREDHDSAQIRGVYPYKFAMGCVPDPGGDASQSPVEPSSQPQNKTSSGADRPSSNEGQLPTRSDQKKTGT